jgi:quinoprotein glucose dehydrogenase
VLVTRTLVFVGVIPGAGAQPAQPDDRRKLIYAFDKTSGALLHAIELDAFSAAAPMTYLHRGTQYIVVATGSGPTSELIALRLPSPAAG